LFVIGIGLSFATLPTVALGDANPDEAGSASGSFSLIQQLASAMGSAAVTSIFFQAARSGMAHAIDLLRGIDQTPPPWDYSQKACERGHGRPRCNG
jgi:hypothetical protein